MSSSGPGSGALDKAYPLATGALREESDNLVREGVIFAATGIMPWETLNGVRYSGGGGRKHTVVMCTGPRMVRFMNTIHAPRPGAGTQGLQL